MPMVGACNPRGGGGGASVRHERATGRCMGWIEEAFHPWDGLLSLNEGLCTCKHLCIWYKLINKIGEPMGRWHLRYRHHEKRARTIISSFRADSSMLFLCERSEVINVRRTKLLIGRDKGIFN